MDELDKIIEEIPEEDISPEEREMFLKIRKEIEEDMRKGRYIIVNGMTKEEFLNIFRKIKNND